MTLRALPSEFEEDRETYLPDALPQDDLDGHAWVEVDCQDMLPEDPERRGRWFQSTHICRRCRRVARTTNGLTRPRLFTVRLGVHVAEACPEAGRLTRAKVWLAGCWSPGPARH